MQNSRQFVTSPEWNTLSTRLQEIFQEHVQSAIEEEDTIATVRYHKGWIDAINFVMALPMEILPDPAEDYDELEEDKQSPLTFDRDNKRSGEVY